MATLTEEADCKPLMELTGLSTAQIAAWMESRGEPAYRGKQIAEWIYRKGARSFEEMKNLPVVLREQLALEAEIGCSEVHLKQQASDGTVKCLLKLRDGQIIECVLLPYEDRVSVCLSTQIGCAMGCRFCATAQGGFTRNLTVGEIVDQLLMLQQFSERKITHVVFMGMGEPLLNLENTLTSIERFHKELGIGMRRFTISTVGIVPKILTLAERDLPITLAVSLHAPDDETRRGFMPVSRKWDVPTLLDACRHYFERTGRRVTFEYLLLKEVNDTPDHARDLAALLKGFPCLVNLIPFNYVSTEQGFQRPEVSRVQVFRAILEKTGIQVTQRQERGRDIDAACGQLRGKHFGKPLKMI